MKGITRNKRIKRNSNRRNKTSKRYVKYGGYTVPQEVIKITPKGTKITPKGTKITPKGTKYIKKN